MKIYQLNEVCGFLGDSYYCIENERTLGYYFSKEKAEAHPKYKEYLKKDKEEKEMLKNMSDEDFENYREDEPYYVSIDEIEVIE